ncbi:MAG: helix-turn-helix domain-containing protein [Candidatus Contendobacter sp.]|nr:helix-turn-helix domain-containing protein [Candidatus Contendobacter sp.]
MDTSLLSSRRERKRDALRQRIVDAAMSLFDAEGYATVTMERIAAAADIAKGTLYKYFPVKEAIVAAFMIGEASGRDEEVSALMANVPDVRGRLLALYEGIAAWSVQHRDYMAAYIAYRLSEPNWYAIDERQRTGFHRHLTRVLAAGRTAGELRDDIPLELSVAYLQSMQLAATLVWLQQSEADLAVLLRQAALLFLEGAGVRS